ncbi:TRAP transporter small permease subunit [Paracoccus aurantiacus]|uniref:TRAP transporter small permease protein n=1 Tax=Paracoccus aurantiacus TaxID=2599412 RepID=A0A5C6S2E3_9RHOB|nr:TRAP transporter small permease subunit [Paracoccus aurantiacus]TXB68625.1 TRAP transporter small permease subunit [Paracoccus aurantiacus]
MFEEERSGRSGLAAVVAVLATGWALLGGLVLLAVVGINALSVAGAALGHPLAGDFEMTEMGIAVAVFAFLPYCQLTDANVTADIFTARASARSVSALRALAALVACGFAAVLLWRMSLGLADHRSYSSITAILQIPVWWAFVPVLVSLVLLIATSVLSFIESLREAVA